MSSITEFYNENGYYHARGVYSPKEIKALEADFDRIVAQLAASGEKVAVRWSGAAIDKIGAKDSVVVHTHNVQKYSAVWLRALLQPRFLEITNAILGQDVVLHHTKLFQKPAEKGAPFPMHQDWSYFPSLLDTMMAGVIHVSEADEAMGCLRVVPGSHKLGRLAQSDGQTNAEFSDKYPIDEALAVVAEPGDVVFFNYMTLHGSKPNQSDRIRKTVLVQMHAGNDTIEEGNTHPNERLVLSGWNTYSKRSLAGADSGPSGR
jgi:ectoine hydroxylase-related dioxygenase (phytanoyl-CoA dioxygenase family)